MASADFWPSISAPCSANSTRQMARSPRVLRTHLHAYARRIYVTAFRTCIGLCISLPAYPAVPPLSASCSSRQRFASGFLQTPSRPGNPCLPLTLAHVGCVEDFHLQMSAPCRAHNEKPGGTCVPPGQFSSHCGKDPAAGLCPYGILALTVKYHIRGAL